MANIAKLLTEYMDIWTAADTEKKSGRGRASGNAGNVSGVKKLRELILELAVRGKLVPQDPSDEPANELLKRVQAEKAKLVAEGKLKKQKPVAPIGEDEKPFELPNGWKWVRVDEVGHDWGQKTPNQEFTYIEVSAIDNHRGLVVSPEVVKPEDAPSRARKVVKQNTIIYSTVRPYLLNIAVIDTEFKPEAIASTAFAIIHPYCEMPSRYFLYYLRSPVFIQYVESVQTGIAYPAINDGQFFSGLLALPPLSEQQRIIAKVDELMALCDQLEQQHSNAQEAHEALVSQLLATLTQSQNAAEFNSNWQRIYANFDVLFTTEASIDTLKQTLLQLAVMGKLVPQDPNDEPASELLKRIQAEKNKLIAEGKLKKEKLLAPISVDEKPFELPKGWEWVRFEHIAENSKHAMKAGPFGSALKKDMYCDSGYKIYGQEQVISGDENLGDYYINETKFLQLLSCSVKPGDILISLVGTIGKLLILSINCKPGIINPRLVKISLFEEIVRPYIKLTFSSPLFRDEMMNQSHGGTMNILNLGLLSGFVLPLPCIAEQKRIVAKLDALMALCDQLKNRIQQANQQQLAIADALVAHALKPATAEIINLAAYRAAITSNIIKRMQHNRAFGRTFAVKLLYLSQQHIGFNTHLEFEREAAGPFDKWIYDFERDGIAAGWFGLVEKQLSSGYTKIEYQVKSAIDQPLALMNSVGSTEQRKELERLFALFADKKTEEAEIVATLFAAWNDFLLGGLSPTEEQIIQEVRENWHPAKAKFSYEQLKQWLNWLRDNNIVPTGKGYKTIYQKHLIN